MLQAIFGLSEGRRLTDQEIDAARASRETFLRRSCVKFVVLDKNRASPQLRAFAVDALQLTKVHEDAAYVLFQPVDAPACNTPVGSLARRVP